MLRLLCWCQFVQRGELLSVVPEADIANLTGIGFMKLYESGDAFVLTAKGKRALDTVLDGRLPTITQSYHTRAIERRLHLASMILTAYKASVEVFTTEIEELTAAPSLFLSTITRGRGGDPWGGTRVGALVHLPDMVAAMHYVAPGIGNISFVDEIGVLVNQSAVVKDAARAFIFAGESYTGVLKELESRRGFMDSKLVPYGDAWRTSPYPVYLLPCTDTGAKQLRLMSVPDYRRWFSQGVLQAEYEPPPEDCPDWDAIFRDAPFVMAADMDLRRIDRAIEAAARLGYPSVSMAAMDAQAQEVLYPRYADTGKAKVFVWTSEMEEELFGGRLKLRAPKNIPFKNAKGDYVDAPLIQADRKSGGQSRK